MAVLKLRVNSTFKATFSSSLAVFLLAVAFISAAYCDSQADRKCPEHQDLQAASPQWGPDGSNFCAYYGQLKCQQGHPAFYHLFKNSNLENAPLVLLLVNAESNVQSLSRDARPYRIITDESKDIQASLAMKESWNDVADVLYIDKYFSYGPTQYNGGEDKVNEAYEYIVAFFERYPEYWQREFLIIGGDDSLTDFTNSLVHRIDHHNRPRGEFTTVHKNQFKMVSALKIEKGAYLKAPYRLKDEELDSAFLKPHRSGTFLTSLPISYGLKQAIEFLWTVANMNDFCVIPKGPTFALPFFQAYYRQFGIETPEINANLNSKKYFERTYEKQKQPTIPLKTHRVWITDRKNGTEIFNVFKNSSFFEEMVKTNKRLDDDNHKWQHYFWVNDRKAIPQSVEWMEANGFIVKEIHELKQLDKDTDFIIKQYESERFGAAADIARFAILLEEGGFYLDLDFFVNSWDNEIMHYFDSIHWKNNLGFDSWTLNTYALLIKPEHSEIKHYLDVYKSHYFSQGTEKKPFHQGKCLDLTQGITLYETGPFFFTAIFIQDVKKGATKDIVLREIDSTGPQTYRIKTSKGDVKEVSFWVQELGLGSWIDDFTDALRFGFALDE